MFIIILTCILYIRFDLIYLILDKPDPAHDRALANHILSFYLNPDTVEKSQELSEEKNDTIPTSLLAKYISYANSNITPVISEAAGIEFINCYVRMRNPESMKAIKDSNNSNKTITFTTRQLESTIRLAEALARMTLSSEVTVEDVREANR